MKEKSLLITLFDRGDEMQKLELKSYLEERDIYILNGKTNKVKEQNLEGTFIIEWGVIRRTYYLGLEHQ